MSWKDHQPTEHGNGEVRCIWDHEPWPCGTIKVAVEVLRDVATEIKPLGSEPSGSVENVDIQGARWDTRNDVAEEIEDMIPDGLK